jgi:hypothetical protein
MPACNRPIRAGQPQPDIGGADRGSRHRGVALLLISIAQLMFVLDELVVTSALPYVQQALRFTFLEGKPRRALGPAGRTHHRLTSTGNRSDTT